MYRHVFDYALQLISRHFQQDNKSADHNEHAVQRALLSWAYRIMTCPDRLLLGVCVFLCFVFSCVDKRSSDRLVPRLKFLPIL
jgi:hypothetical protein